MVRKARTKKVAAAPVTALAVPQVNLPALAEPAVRPVCTPQVTSDALVDYAVHEYEKNCRKQVDIVRRELASAMADTEKVTNALSNLLKEIERELHLAFFARAEQAFDSLGFTLGKEHIKTTLRAETATRGKVEYKLQKGGYDGWTRSDSVELSAEYKTLHDEQARFSRVADKIRKKFLYWQSKLDETERVRRDIRSKLTAATLSKLRGGEELLQNLMAGFADHYLQGPADE